MNGGHLNIVTIEISDECKRGKPTLEEETLEDSCEEEVEEEAERRSWVG